MEKHSDITGTFTLALRVDTKVVKESKGQVKPLGEIDYENRHDDSTEAFSKSTWFVDGKGKVIQYAIRVNGGKKDYQNVEIKATLISAGLKYKDGSFTIKKGDWKLTQTGNIPGEAFSNKAQMTADNIEPIDYTANVVYQTSSGNATGYTYTLKAHKENQLGEPLSGAVFDVIRDSTGERVQIMTTGADGTAQITGLLRVNYTLVETKAPEGYQATDEQLEIKATEFVMEHHYSNMSSIKLKRSIFQGKRLGKIKITKMANGPKRSS